MNNIPVDILKKASQGDLGAFEEMYKATSGFVYNVAFKITQNSADAEEVTQDVFMKIYRSLKDFEFRSSFKTWAYRIAANTAINLCRSRAKDKRGRVDFDEISEALPAKSSFEAELNRGEAKVKLDKLMQVLSPEFRACLVLREIEGLDYQEISRSLNIPINTVRSRLSRARQALLGEAQKGWV